MSLYIPQMGDAVGVTIPGLAGNFASIGTHVSKLATQAGGVHGLEVEYGIWTPTVGQVGAATPDNSITYTTQEGTYARIGNLVYVTASVVIAERGTDNLTAWTGIRGLPFVPSHFSAMSASRANFSLPGDHLLPQVEAGRAFVALNFSNTNGTTEGVPSNAWVNGSRIVVSGIYLTEGV